MITTVAPTTAGEERTELVLDIIQWGEGLALAFLFVISLMCLHIGGKLLVNSMKAIEPKDRVLYRRHWGGFGGDSSGWQISAPLAATALGVVLIALGVSLATSVLFVLHQHEIVKPKQELMASSPATPAASTGDKKTDADVLKTAAPAASVATGEEPPRAPASAP